MSERTLKRAIMSLAALAIIYALVLLTRDGSSGPAAAGALGSLEGLDEATMSGAVITGPENSIELSRSGAGWTVNGYVADSAAVGRFWEAVEALEVRDLAASNPDNHARLGVAADSTWRVAFRPTEGDPIEVLLGRAGASFSSAYARVPDSDAVYLIEGGIRGAATRRVEDWRDKTIVAVDTGTVTVVSLTRDDVTSSVTRTAEGWFIEGEPADSAAVANVLSELGSFQATGFAADSVAFEGTERRRVVAMDQSGDTLAAVDVLGTDGTFLARSTTSPVIFTVPNWRLDRLVPSAEDLAAELPPSEDGN